MPANVIITIDGKRQEDIELDLTEVVVDTNLYLPAMFSLTVKDTLDPQSDKLKYTDADTFKVGAEVKIEVETDEIPSESFAIQATLTIGEITSTEPEFRADGLPYLHIQGYDRLHHLTRGTHTRTYGDANPQGSGIGEDQIVKTIVGEVSAITKAEIDSSGLSALKYPYVMQYNQSDLDFLWERARAIGYQVYVEDKTLYFQKADAIRAQAEGDPAALRWPLNLENFIPRLTVMRQVDKAVVTGWDPATKKSIEGSGNSDSSKTAPKLGLEKRGGALAKDALGGEAVTTVVDQPVLTVDQAKAIAAARFSAAEGESIRADGICRDGDPRLIAGKVASIEGVGERFGGDYYVTEARHVWGPDGYQVTFSVTGRTPNTISYLLRGDDRRAERVTGLVTAKVVNLEDPEELGRVQVMFPWLPKYKDADLASNWARIATPMGGKERGFFFLPEIDDEVLVGFEHGDVNYPYIVGTLWNKTDKPPAGSKDSVLSSDKKLVDQRVIRSRSGHLIVLDDTDGEEQILIQDKSGKNQVIINSKENSLTINVEEDVNITAKGKATIDASDVATIKTAKDLNIECQNLSIKANQNVTLEATSNLDLKATGQLNLKGMKASMVGDSMAEVKSNTAVQIQSSAMVKVQGNPIMLN